MRNEDESLITSIAYEYEARDQSIPLLVTAKRRSRDLFLVCYRKESARTGSSVGECVSFYYLTIQVDHMRRGSDLRARLWLTMAYIPFTITCHLP